MSKGALRAVDFGLRDGEIFLVGRPGVGAVAVFVGNENRSSLVGAYEDPVALALADELEVTFLDDVVDCGLEFGAEAGAAAYVVEVLLGVGNASAGGHEKLGCVEKSLGVAVDSPVVVVVEL